MKYQKKLKISSNKKSKDYENRTRSGKIASIMESSDGYKKYLIKESIEDLNEFDFREILHCTMDSSQEILNRSYSELIQHLETCQKTDLINFLKKLKDKSIFIKREVDEGIISQTINLPCILSSDLRLNTPRFIPLPKIIQAKTKPIEKISLNSLEVNYTPEIERTALSLPEKRQKGEMVEDLDQLIEILKGVLK